MTPPNPAHPTEVVIVGDRRPTDTDAYVKGYNQGRADEANHLANGAALFKTPDVTPVQMVAVAGALLAVAASFGFDVTQQQQDAIMQLVSIVAGLLLAGDAVIRHGRATGNAKKDV